MNRTTTLATLAGLSLTAASLAQTQTGVPAGSGQGKQPPASSPTSKPRTPVKPSIVDLQDAAKQPRKRAPRTPSAATPVQPTATPSPAPAVAPAPAVVPAPELVQPLVPVVTQPLSTPAPVAQPEITAAPAAPVAPTIEPAQSAPTVTASSPVVDIESVAVKPVKGELRQSPVQIGAQETTRSARQPVTEPSPAVAPIAQDAPAQTEPTATTTQPTQAANTNDQRVPNPAASLLPSAPTPSVLSASFVESLVSTPIAAAPAKPLEPVDPAPVVTPAPEAPAPVAPAPLPAEPPVVARPLPAPVPEPSTPVAPIEPPTPAAPVKPVETTIATPKPLDIKPSVEPLPPAPSTPTPVAPTVAPAPVATTNKPVEPAPPLPAMPVEVRPIEVGNDAVRPAEVKGPEVSPIDTSKIKLSAPAASTAQAAPEAKPTETVPAPVEALSKPSTETAPVVAPVPAAPPATIATGTAAAVTPAAQPDKAADPEPVSLKVLSLTGTAGMVQWQIDGGSQWLIPELDETTKARFIVRTGPDAGVEMLVDAATRVRLGRFSRAEIRTLETRDDAGSGKRLNVQLMRGVVYVTPAKGQVVTVQTPARAVIVKEPMQVTHDNSGTRSVSFTEQPNPGTSATAPSANP